MSFLYPRKKICSMDKENNVFIAKNYLQNCLDSNMFHLNKLKRNWPFLFNLLCLGKKQLHLDKCNCCETVRKLRGEGRNLRFAVERGLMVWGGISYGLY